MNGLDLGGALVANHGMEPFGVEPVNPVGGRGLVFVPPAPGPVEVDSGFYRTAPMSLALTFAFPSSRAGLCGNQTLHKEL